MSRLPPQLVAAAARRQHILDCLHAHPGADMPAINAWIAARDAGADASNTLRTMIDWQEIRHEGDARRRRYFALVETTRSAEECKAMREANLAASNRAKQRAALSAESAQAEPWRHVHRPGKHPIKNAGGQGALRRRVYINCGGSHV